MEDEFTPQDKDEIRRMLGTLKKGTDQKRVIINGDEKVRALLLSNGKWKATENYWELRLATDKERGLPCPPPRWRGLAPKKYL